jgi:hypothetical protein
MNNYLVADHPANQSDYIPGGGLLAAPRGWGPVVDGEW